MLDGGSKKSSIVNDMRLGRHIRSSFSVDTGEMI